MAEYIAMRIGDGKMDYVQVITLYPQFKKEVDDFLIRDNHEEYIKEIPNK